jgi:hypothetical protein
VQTVARTTGGLAVEVDGLQETLKAFGKLERELRAEANGELRDAADKCASGLVVSLVGAAASSGVPVAPRVARSIKVKRDRVPMVAIGGATKVGTGKRGQAGALVWGSEQGPKSDPNRFGVAPNSAGYWIAPTVARFADGPAIEVYKRAVYVTMRKHGLV